MLSNVIYGHIDGLIGINRGYGVVQRNFEGRMQLEFCLEKELCLTKTWSKGEEKSKVTSKI